jgi:hypothetical protein
MSTTPNTPFSSSSLYPSTPAGVSFQTVVCQPVFQQPVYTATTNDIGNTSTLLSQQTPQISNNPLIYFVNDVPHYCYPQQSEILYPVYVPSATWPPCSPYYDQPRQFSVPNQRFLGEVVEAAFDASGNVLKQELNKIEQQVVNDVKSRCCGLC